MDAVLHPAWEGLIGRSQDAGIELAPGDGVAYRLRSVKTDAEQAVIDEAYRIARAGLEAAARAVTPGATEREVAAAAEAAMRHAGAEGFGIDTMVASGFDNTSPIIARSTFRRIGKEDLVWVTLAPRYEGYHAALARPFLFAANPDVETAIEVARAGQRAGAKRLVAGTKGADAALVIREQLEGGGTGAELPYVPIHSIGMIEFEPPIFLSSSEVLVQDGMALSIDAALFHGPWGGLRIEDGLAIRDGAAQPRFGDYEDIVPVMLVMLRVAALGAGSTERARSGRFWPRPGCSAWPPGRAVASASTRPRPASGFRAPTPILGSCSTSASSTPWSWSSRPRGSVR